MRHILFIIAIITGCSSHEPKSALPSSLVGKLQTKYAQWISTLKTESDQATGWPSATDCDGTLWAGEALASGYQLDIHLAEYTDGEIHRRPKVSGECYPAESASTVSNDMLAGYMWGLWKTKDLDAAERLQAYGEAHNWKMGEGDARTILSPVGSARLARLVKALGGPEKPYAELGDPCLPVEDDYEHHLQDLGILLDGQISSGVSSGCLIALKNNSTSYTQDGLFAAAYGVYSGNMDAALSLLTNDGYICPSYVRGSPSYCDVHKLFAASIALGGFGK